MKKNKKIFVVLIAIFLLTATGCNKNLKGVDNKVVVNEETGQNLPANIMCKPTDEEILKLYRKTNKELTEKYKKQLEEKEITQKNYDKKMKSLVDVDSLVSCNEFKVTSGGYEGIWNSVFIKPLSWIIIKIGMLVKNYGLAIIVTTFLIRLIMYPVTLKTARQSESMKKAGPELSKLEKKYANKTDQQSMMEKNQEMMAIYKKYGINPMSGCLFGFIQIPLFFAFYESLYRLPVLFEDKFLAFELSTAPLKAIGKGHWLYIVLPLLVAVTTFFSFKLNSGASMNQDQAKQMKYMMIFMMFMIVFMSFSMSSAIILYWITNSTFTIVQNVLVKRRK